MENTILLQQIKGGHPEAFKQLVDQYHHKVINTCYGFVHNKEDAEDIAQDTFIKAFNNLRKYDQGRSFKNWIYSIAANTCKNHF